MTEDQEKFFQVLNQFERFAHHWDQEGRTLNVDQFEQDLKLMSSGERHIAKFLASVWLNDNEHFPFNLMEAMYVLDYQYRQVIIDWITDPFYP